MTKLKIEVTANHVKVGESEFMREIVNTAPPPRKQGDWVLVSADGRFAVANGRFYRAAVAP